MFSFNRRFLALVCSHSVWKPVSLHTGRGGGVSLGVPQVKQEFGKTTLHSPGIDRLFTVNATLLSACCYESHHLWHYRQDRQGTQEIRWHQQPRNTRASHFLKTGSLLTGLLPMTWPPVLWPLRGPGRPEPHKTFNSTS